MHLPNKVYDVAKWVAQILLPALGALYYALSSLWNLPNPDSVVGTIVAINAFLGVILGLSTVSYNNKVKTLRGR